VPFETPDMLDFGVKLDSLRWPEREGTSCDLTVPVPSIMILSSAGSTTT